MKREMSFAQEREPSPTYDAVLVHSYWLSRSNHPDAVYGFRGSLRTRLATRSGALLYHNEGPTKLVFLGGKLKGPSYPSTAELSAAEATQKYGIPPEDIIALPVGYGTEEEAFEFQELAQDYGWKNVAVVAFRPHYRSIRRFIPEGTSEEIAVTYRPVENLVREYDNPYVQELVQGLKRLISLTGLIELIGLKKWSGYELGFKTYELFKDVVMSIPGGKDRLYTRSKKARTEKDDSRLNDFIAHRIDIFKS